jgi:hypothetical protein
VAALDDEVKIKPPMKVATMTALTRRYTEPRVNWELLAFVRAANVPTGNWVGSCHPWPFGRRS